MLNFFSFLWDSGSGSDPEPVRNIAHNAVLYRYFIHKRTRNIAQKLECCTLPVLYSQRYRTPPRMLYSSPTSPPFIYISTPPLSYPNPSPTYKPILFSHSPHFFLKFLPRRCPSSLKTSPTFPNLPFHPYPINPLPSFYLQSHPFLPSPPALCNPYRESPVSRGSPYFHKAACRGGYQPDYHNANKVQ
jgi:hypothetical protein